jgi:hypothetical protein
LSLKTKVEGLSVVWPQNHWDDFSSIWASKPMAMVCEWFGLKTTQTVFTSLASKPVVTVSSGLASKLVATVSGGLSSKPAATVSSGLASKPVATVSWFGHQNQADFGLSVAPQNQRMEVGAGHTSRSSDLLHVEGSLARVSQSGLKTDGGTTTGGARGTIAEVASEAS